MEKELLEECLGEGLSLEAIGKRVGKHESTVSYWLKKHGLEAARGGEARGEGRSRQKRRWKDCLPPVCPCERLLHRLDRSLATIRHWMGEVRAETSSSAKAWGGGWSARESSRVQAPR